ncbi:MAG: UDP-N-acetylmuramate--L-alanine ligase [Bacteroidales bacterium]|jgi:UDP-N-acetylmuramate--alanine ligase|nr:UDP-N-acetylmuramate--L-alanine ligase [Bacteroidales bacterium]
MMEFINKKGVYFIGIGGIGMSALARCFLEKKYVVAGYDRTPTRITKKFEEAGCSISFNDDIVTIPPQFRDIHNKGNYLIVFTPAIPADNRILSFFRNNGYNIKKRSEVLGEISAETNTVAIAGTHGKTTVSTMTAHLLKQSHVDCIAFLGGISKNYGSNFIKGNSRYTIIEADEYDRSFHRLIPQIAVITAIDSDHLEVYGNHETMVRAYNEFGCKIRHGGTMICRYAIREHISAPEGVRFLTYGREPEADFYFYDVENLNQLYRFSIKTPGGLLKDLQYTFPGVINIENMTAAVAVASICGVPENEIRKAILTFQGVRRRFDIRINTPDLSYIDDYAHHPEEIKACILSLKEYFGQRKITGIFQPHLFTRTRDYADGFAEILDQLDEVILLPVYPAREMPIPGVSSEMILSRMKNSNKRLLAMNDVLSELDPEKLDVLVTIGAGDIDTLVEPIEMKLRKGASR